MHAFDFETATRTGPRRGPGTGPRRAPKLSDELKPPPAGIEIPPGSRKSVLICLCLELWRRGDLRSVDVPEARGRHIEDEAMMSRALMRSTTYQLEQVAKAAIGGKRREVVVTGRLTGASRTKLEDLGLVVREERPEDERRYLDMTPCVIAGAAVMMALRYISLGLNDQALYVLAGISFAVFSALRPFLYRMQRPGE